MCSTIATIQSSNTTSKFAQIQGAEVLREMKGVELDGSMLCQVSSVVGGIQKVVRGICGQRSSNSLDRTSTVFLASFDRTGKRSHSTFLHRSCVRAFRRLLLTTIIIGHIEGYYRINHISSSTRKRGGSPITHLFVSAHRVPPSLPICTGSPSLCTLHKVAACHA